MLRSAKFLLVMLVCAALAPAAQAQVLRSATDRAAQIHWYQKSLAERATQEARELSRLLNLNESEMQLVRQFATERLQAENDAQAYITTDAGARREAQDRAAAQFQTRLVNTLNESQMQRYFQLLAETSANKGAASPAPIITKAVMPTTPVAVPVEPAVVPVEPLTPVPAAPAPASVALPGQPEVAAPVIIKPIRRQIPIGTYHTRPVRRR